MAALHYGIGKIDGEIGKIDGVLRPEPSPLAFDLPAIETRTVLCRPAIAKTTSRER